MNRDGSLKSGKHTVVLFDKAGIMRTFVIGDIHGEYKALVKCLNKSGFDYAADRLIVLGDIYDGPNPQECIEHLLTIDHLLCVAGNHDLDELEMARHSGSFSKYTQFINKMLLVFEEEGCLFVHGGFDPHKPFMDQDVSDFTWNRSLVAKAWQAHRKGEEFIAEGFREVYVGHTCTQMYGQTTPMQLGNIFMIDTGAGYGGHLTIMDINSKKFWQAEVTR